MKPTTKRKMKLHDAPPTKNPKGGGLGAALLGGATHGAAGGAGGTTSGGTIGGVQGEAKDHHHGNHL
jgi:hypothetical protein